MNAIEAKFFQYADPCVNLVDSQRTIRHVRWKDSLRTLLHDP
jgi:hypothetical protein